MGHLKERITGGMHVGLSAISEVIMSTHITTVVLCSNKHRCGFPVTDEYGDVSAMLALSSNSYALPWTVFPVQQVPIWRKSSKPGSHNLMPSCYPLTKCSGWQSFVRLRDQALSETLLPARGFIWSSGHLLLGHWVKQMRRPRPEVMRSLIRQQTGSKS